MREAISRVSEGVERLGAGYDSSAFIAIQMAVERLDWLFQGHFTGEEDGLFLPAEDLLSPAILAELARRMATLTPAPGEEGA